jgi:hypothetical protein
MRGFYRLEWHPKGSGLIHTDPSTGQEVFVECGVRNEPGYSPDRPEQGETVYVTVSLWCMRMYHNC